MDGDGRSRSPFVGLHGPEPPHLLEEADPRRVHLGPEEFVELPEEALDLLVPDGVGAPEGETEAQDVVAQERLRHLIQTEHLILAHGAFLLAGYGLAQLLVLLLPILTYQ